MRLATVGFVAIASVLLALPVTASADTYAFYDLGSADHGRDVLGITSSGSVVISWLGSSDTFYETWTNGVRVSLATTNPGLTYDNGATCSPTVSPTIGSGNVTYAKCNGSREVFGTGHYAPAPYANSIFDGPNPSDWVAFHMIETPFNLNASGDFVVVADQLTYPSDGEIFEYVDLSTAPVPEPSSIILVGLGVLALAGAASRRGFVSMG